MSLHRSAGAASLFALALSLAGCGLFTPDIRPADVERDCASRSGTTSDEASRLLLEGARVFDDRCSPCHGDTGHGDGMLAELLPIRPRNYHEEAFRWGTSWEQIAATVRGGRSGVMPPFVEALSEPQIRAVSFLVACWVERR